MNRRSRTLAGLVALATAGATLTVLPPAAAVPSVAPAGGARHQVTLITGDQVQASQRGDGSWSMSINAAEQGRSAGFRQFPVTRGKQTDWYLVPQHAERALAEGQLDRELFNITGLIRQGYDDAHSKVVPLLVEHYDAAAQRAKALPGVTVQRELSGLNLTAVDGQKAAAPEFWQELGTARAGGVRKIWLNGKVEASLDRSVPQVGAPAAWQSGLTGKGVTVAVLDSGIDDTHPDVAGKVKHSKDFSGKGNITDGNGHGTHVAAAAVGSGSAEGGKLKGVAPEAELAVGKVLDDNGRGQFDDIIAGMAWAAAEVKAKVVNLSLGSRSDSDDPLTQAVNTLSRKHNTLFVVAAGNDGSPRTVMSPASADLALAVGSVTKSGGLSDFSSQGPRRGDGAVKPEISAPGSDIVAARATGTAMGEPVNERYTKASGTSMAAPHVSGGAAALAQQHPDWTAEQLKSALVATSAPVDHSGVFAVGSGRMDLGKAVAAKVQSSPSAVNAFLKWPSTKAETRTVTYTNPGSTPATLNLKLDLADTEGAPAPAGLAKLSANTVTVPPGGQATVTVSLTPRAAKAGSYGGTLTATDGTTSLRTLVGAHEEGEHYEVTAKVLRRDGKPPTAQDFGDLSLSRTQDGEHFSVPANGTARVPPGEYLVYSAVNTPNPNGIPAISTFVNPALKISKNTTVTFDARLAKQVKISTDQPEARGGWWAAQMRHRITATGRVGTWGHGLSIGFYDYSTYSAPGVSSPAFSFATNQRREEPDLELWAEGPQRTELYTGWLRGSPQDALRHKLPSVHGGAGTPAELAKVDAKGKIVVLGLPDGLSYDEVYQRIRDVKAAGGMATALYVSEDQPLRATAKSTDEEHPAVLPSVRVFGGYAGKLAAHAKAGGELSLIARTSSKHRYELAFPSMGKIPAKLDHHVKTADLAKMTMVYHGAPPGQPPIVGAYAETPSGQFSVNVHAAAVPGERVEYFSPGTWEINVGSWYHAAGTLVKTMKLEAGKSYREEWNKAVNGPGFTGTTSNELGENHPWVWVKDRLLDVTVPWWSDAAGHPRRTEPGWGIDKGSTTLYGDGVELGRHNTPGRGVFTLGRAREYRLESEVTREVDWWPTSTRITSAWTFAAPWGNNAVPLLNIRYAPPVDIGNLAPGDREFTIPVTVPRQDGPATVTSLTVDYSVDEGKTWQQAKVDKTEAGWTATVRNPAKGFVSLRGKASDEVNTVEQTVLKAYEIG
ncbi:S8 family serine peptidase [Crossiella sp. NPDC003009]